MKPSPASPGSRCGPTRGARSRGCCAQGRLLDTPTARWRRSSRRACGPTASSRSATASLMPIRGIIRMSTSASRSTSRRPCKDGHCVSAQIERNARLLADPKVPQREKLMALAFLVHFVGDLHQPMHAGDHGDLGGNKVRGQLRADRRADQFAQHLGRLARRARDHHPAGRRRGAARPQIPPAERERDRRRAASRTGAARYGARRATSPTSTFIRRPVRRAAGRRARR